MIWFLTIVLPLLAAFFAVFLPAGRRGSGFILAGAALPALWLGLVEVSGVTAPWFLMESHFSLDTPRRIILLLTAILWATAGLFSGSYLKDDARRGEFSFYFGLTMAGNFGLLISADVASFYTFFALMTFASYGLVIHSRTPSARRAANIYLVMAIIGELFLITALYLAVESAGSMLLADIPPALAESPDGPFIFLLGLIGFGVKVGAIPLYFWLPLAHPAAPAPASAVLSGAMIKAGLVGWMHLAPVGLVEWTFLSLLMVSLGFTAVFGAAIYGLTQVDPKANLAYSSISQMGVMTVLLGIGLYGDIPPELLLPAIALYAFNHGTAKALLFMGTALPAKVGGAWRILMWVGLGLGVLSIAGGPLTGGLWTKSLVKTFLGETSLPGAQTFMLLLKLSAVTTALLLSRFLHLLYRIKAPSGNVAPAFFLPWVLLLLAGGWWTMSPGLLPGELLSHISGAKGIMDFFMNLQKNWTAFWTISIGVIIMAFTLKFTHLNVWPTKKPSLPPGDFIHLILFAGAAVAKPLRKGISLLESGIQSIPGPEKIFYIISDSKRTSRISSAAEALLRRWEFVGIGFFIFFLILFLVLR
ncbi:complex I subunit 5 family protein [Marinilabilia rubra]|uniref:NADH-ubiquinone oxidoreductase n=1 Tax=Marinilabilia rubra TaxID=2162893 RepID=A0A2U2B955_9BACT|nr:complex I subunit 5 family protein [Marinilabilia rubra]PWD99582.1 NADH-ubiquinone oxidoreductase [Marinilabilia rubra]